MRLMLRQWTTQPHFKNRGKNKTVDLNLMNYYFVYLLEKKLKTNSNFFLNLDDVGAMHLALKIKRERRFKRIHPQVLRVKEYKTHSSVIHETLSIVRPLPQEVPIYIFQECTHVL